MNISIQQITSIEDLWSLFAKYAKTKIENIDGKLHKIYFEGYLESVRAGLKTVIIEEVYVDRDFLEDYSAYYARCFQDYGRFCARFHFFSLTFDEQSFFSLLEGNESAISVEDLKKNYLGFVVIKPLPDAIIGRTCLAVYEDDGKRRNYPAIRDYPVNLCGINLSVKSLAYQEQDTVVAACATSALWSVFHSTGMLFQHEILSPVEITRRATEYVPIDNRAFPSSGLTLT